MDRLLHLGSVTTDHWTGPGQGAQTFSTTTFHYIEDWAMRLMLLGFKVFEGTTSGEAIFEDQKEVLKLTEGAGSPLIFLQ